MKLKLTALFIGLLAIIFALLPWLFVQVADWQKAFNQLISENLHQIQAHSSTAGLWLIFAAFSYGVLHALGLGMENLLSLVIFLRTKVNLKPAYA